METLLGIGFLIVVYVICKVLPEQRFDNYMPPQGYTVDHKALNDDRIRNHLTNEQVMRNTVNGKYNVKR